MKINKILCVIFVHLLVGCSSISEPISTPIQPTPTSIHVLIPAETPQPTETPEFSPTSTPANFPETANDCTAQSVEEIPFDEEQVILGRCHMDSCWWMNVDSAEIIQSVGEDKLMRICHKVASIRQDTWDNPSLLDNPPESAKRINGYLITNFPTSTDWKNAKPTEVFIFCSQKLPAFISIDTDRSLDKYNVSIIFDRNGSTGGPTEGVGNLYSYICNGKPSKVEVSNETIDRLNSSDFFIEKPVDVFGFINLPTATPTPTEKPLRDWEGIPIMPNAITGESGNRKYVYTIYASPDEVRKFYEQELEKLGWNMFKNVDGHMLLFTKDTETTGLNITITSGTGGITVVKILK